MSQIESVELLGEVNEPLDYLIEWFTPGTDSRESKCFNTEPEFEVISDGGRVKSCGFGEWTGGIFGDGLWYIKSSFDPAVRLAGYAKSERAAMREVESEIIKLFRARYPDWPLPERISREC